MLTQLFSLPSHLLVEDVLIENDVLTLVIKSTLMEVPCPDCRQFSSRIHSRYTRLVEYVFFVVVYALALLVEPQETSAHVQMSPVALQAARAHRPPQKRRTPPNGCNDYECGWRTDDNQDKELP